MNGAAFYKLWIIFGKGIWYNTDCCLLLLSVTGTPDCNIPNDVVKLQHIMEK
jgi:hypothetical protein